MRLFLAIVPPEPVIEFAVAIQEELRQTIERQGVRFTSPGKMHLTLAFLGDDGNPDEAHVVAERLLSDSGRQPLTTGSVGTFPGLERPKTAWLGVSGERLGGMARTVSSAFGLQDAEFTGHLTLARISPGSKAVGRILESMGPFPAAFASWDATEVQLLKTLPNGDYETLQRYFL